MPHMFVTFPTSQPLRSPLKAAASVNMFAMFVTLRTSQPLRSPSKVLA